MDFFAQNLKCLQEYDPELAERVASQPFPDNITVIRSKDGLPVPKIAGVTLHSQYRPLEEGEITTVDYTFDPKRKAIVF